MYVRSFRRVYEEEIRRFISEVKASLGGPLEQKRKFLPKVHMYRCDGQIHAPWPFVQGTSTADMLRTPLGGSLLSLSPGRERAAFSQSVADVSGPGAFGSPDTTRPRSGCDACTLDL